MGSKVPPITPIFGRFVTLSAITSLALVISGVPARRRAASLLAVTVGDIAEAPHDETESDEDGNRNEWENPGWEEQGNLRLFSRQNDRA